MEYTLRLFDQLIESFGENESEEVRGIIEEIKRTAYSLRTEEETRLYIQNHQTALLRQKNFPQLNSKCDKVLYFLESSFSPFINEKLPISDIGRNKKHHQFKESIDGVSEEIKRLNLKLFDLIKPLTLSGCNSDCSVYFIQYFSQFWHDWLSEISSPMKEEKIISFLISQNFNTPLFFRYLTGEIVGELNQEDDPSIQEHVLLNHSKKIKTIPVKSGSAFRPDYPDIRFLILEWLKAEIKQCRRKVKVQNPKQQAIFQKARLHKIETSLSVAQTACLFRAMSKSGIITNKVQMEILHVISERFRSKKTESISFDSLHNKYYNIEDRTKESVKEILKEVLRNIE